MLLLLSQSIVPRAHQRAKLAKFESGQALTTRAWPCPYPILNQKIKSRDFTYLITQPNQSWNPLPLFFYAKVPTSGCIFPLPPWSIDRHFRGRRSAPINFGLTCNFVGHKKLKRYGVLNYYIFQNQRRYKSCNKTCNAQTKNIHAEFWLTYMGKSSILYLVFLCSMLSIMMIIP